MTTNELKESFERMGYSPDLAEAMATGNPNAIITPNKSREAIQRSFERMGHTPEAAARMAEGRGGNAVLLQEAESGEVARLAETERSLYESFRRLGHPHELALTMAKGRA
jgi:hypothetical protein